MSPQGRILERARRSLMRGESGKAAALLRRALRERGAEPRIARELAFLLMEDGRPDDWIRIWKEHERAFWKDPYLRLVSAQAFARSLRRGEARRLYESLARDPAAASYRSSIKEGLAFLDREDRRLSRIRGAEKRALWLAAGGGACTLLLAAGAWVLARRGRLVAMEKARLPDPGEAGP